MSNRKLIKEGDLSSTFVVPLSVLAKMKTKSRWIARRLAGWLFDWVTGWLADWLSGVRALWLAGWLAVRNWLDLPLADWLWLAGWLASWLADAIFIPMTCIEFECGVAALIIVFARLSILKSLSLCVQQQSIHQNGKNMYLCCLCGSFKNQASHWQTCGTRLDKHWQTLQPMDRAATCKGGPSQNERPLIKSSPSHEEPRLSLAHAPSPPPHVRRSRRLNRFPCCWARKTIPFWTFNTYTYMYLYTSIYIYIYVANYILRSSRM